MRLASHVSLAAPVAALLALAPLAASQTQKPAPGALHELIVSVWQPDGTASTSVVSATLADGSVAKTDSAGIGFHAFTGVGDKTTLLVDDGSNGFARFELGMPSTIDVSVDVFFSGLNVAEAWINGVPADPGYGTPGSGGFLGGPANDDCSAAIPIGVPSSTPGTTVGAAIDGVPFCGTSNTAPGVWYSVVGTGTTMTATTCSAPFVYDTKISVFCNGCVALTCVTGNDDSCALSPFTQSTVSWCSTAGATYLILVHGFSSGVGAFTLDLSENGIPCPDPGICSAPPPVPANDLCPDAIGIGIPSSTNGTTLGAGTDVTAPFCGTGITSPGVWYRVTGTGTTITATTCGPFFDYDTKISVYCGSCDALTCVTGNDDNCVGGADVTLSTVTWCSVAGTEYLVLVHGFGGQSGDFVLDLSEDGVPCNPGGLCPAPAHVAACFCDQGICGNPDPDAGCANSTGSGAQLSASGNASISNDALVLAVTSTANNFGLFFQGSLDLSPGIAFGDGLRCCGGDVVRIGTYLAAGNATDTATGNLTGGFGPPISTLPGQNLSVGATVCYQWWFRDNGGPCGNRFNLSNSVLVTWQF